MAVQVANSAKVVALPLQKVTEEFISDPQEITLRELKDVCKHYFEGIKEEATYESATVERLGKLAGLALEIIDHFEKFGR